LGRYWVYQLNHFPWLIKKHLNTIPIIELH
jgi:hypothetical protein